MDTFNRVWRPLAFILYLNAAVSACVGGSYIPMGAIHGSVPLAKRADEGYAGCVTPSTCAPPFFQEIPDTLWSL